MKLYAHWEGEQAFTKVTKLDDNATIKDLQDVCWSALQARHPALAIGGARCIRLLNADRRALPLSSPLTSYLSSGDDVFFTLLQGNETATQQPNTAERLPNRNTSAAASCFHTRPVPSSQTPNVPVVTAPLGAQSQPQQIRDAAEQPAAGNPPQPQPQLQPPKAAAASSVAAVTGVSSALDHLLPLVHALWSRADVAAAHQNYRNAADTLHQALLLVPQPAHPAHVATVIRLARLWLAAGNPTAAVRWALRAAEAKPEDPEVLELAGDCLRDGGRPREAALHYQSVLEILEERQEQDSPDEAAGSGGDGGGSASASADPSPSQLRLRLSLAACLYEVPGCITPPYDNQALAASLVMAVLERDPGHWDALRLYGRIALDRGIRDDALRVALRLVVARPQHRGAKALLAECLQDESDCARLLTELGASGARQPVGPGGGGGPDAGAGGGVGGGPGTAAALGFLATAVKDHGKVDSCVTLLRHATRLDPGNANNFLNLLHSLELRQELQRAVEAGRAFCRGARAPLAGLRLQEVDSLLDPLPELLSAHQLTWYWAEPRWRQEGPREEGPREEGQQQQEQQEQKEQEQEGPSGGGDGLQSRASGGSRGGGALAAPQPAVKSVSYSPDQLDELALLFAVVKVLFVGGALTAAAQLCDLVEPLRRASATELHTTLIRNEAAYFGCVLQLLRDQPPPPALDGDAAPAPLYLCGDSHCLSAAWRYVTLRGERRLLRPMLVTGCKVWHLRPVSEFYPKKQFEATVKLLPDGAQVVLVLGEIDCREGFLVAVQKGKYDSVAEGIETTVAIYIDVLRRLVSERRFEIFVHPVPPALNETRHIVMPFAAALKRAVSEARAADPGLAERLHYLDFFEQLLVPAAAGATESAALTADDSTPAAAKPADSAATGAAGGPAAAGVTSERKDAGYKVQGEASAASGSAPPVDKAAPPTSGISGKAGGGESGEAEAVTSPAGSHAGPSGLTESGVSAVRGAEGRQGSLATGEVGSPADAGDGRCVQIPRTGWLLRPDLVFDGTHLGPAYLPLLDAALQGVR